MSDEDVQAKIALLFKEDGGEKVLFSIKVTDAEPDKPEKPLQSSPRKKLTDKLSAASFMDLAKSGSEGKKAAALGGSSANLNSTPMSPATTGKKKTRYVCMTSTQSDLGSNHSQNKWKSSPSQDKVQQWVRTSGKKLVFGRCQPYTWFVDDRQKKVEFLYVLLKLVAKIKKPPKMINISEASLKGFILALYLNVDELKACRSRVKITDEDGQEIEEEDDEKVQSPMLDDAFLQVQFDQDDLRIDEVLMDYNWKAGGDATALETRLLNELNALEAANLHAIIQADEMSGKVIGLLDKAVKELDKMDQWLGLYHSELLNTGKDIQHIENQNRGLQVQTANQKLLKTEMDKLMAAMAIPDEVTQTLRQQDLESFDGVAELEKACNEIRKALQTKLDEPLNEVTAVKERIGWFGKQTSAFSDRLVVHVTHLVDNETNVYGGHKKSFTGSDVVINYCESLSGLLFPLRNLMEWMKEVEPRRFNELQLSYVQELNKFYRNSIKDVFDSLKSRAVKKLPEDPNYCTLFALTSKGFFGGGSVLTPTTTKSPSMASIMTKTHKRGMSSEGSHTNITLGHDDKGSKLKSKIGESSSSLVEEEKAFANFLGKFVPVLIREYYFIVDFFHFHGCQPAGTLVDDLIDGIDKCRVPQKDMKTKKKLDELMGVMFDGVMMETLSWFEVALKPDISTVVGLLVTLEKFKLETSNSFVISECIPFLATYITQLNDRLKGIYDKFVEDQVKAIDETKLNLRNRSGILSFIRIFPKFVNKMEEFFKNVPESLEMRNSITSCYTRLIQHIFDDLDVIAKDVETNVPADDREQLNAHILTIENMHHLHSELRGLKLTSMDAHVKAAKTQYEQHLNLYIKAIVRKPMGKLLLFFEGMEELLKTKQPDEIPYHLNFNKAAIKKCLASFPGKEVKKSLESLHKRVNKHFTEEEGLLQVVWHGIQEEFIRMHQHYEMLIRKCYSESDIHLLFSVQDMLQYFSDIAKENL